MPNLREEIVSNKWVGRRYRGYYLSSKNFESVLGPVVPKNIDELMNDGDIIINKYQMTSNLYRKNLIRRGELVIPIEMRFAPIVSYHRAWNQARPVSVYITDHKISSGKVFCRKIFIMKSSILEFCRKQDQKPPSELMNGVEEVLVKIVNTDEFENQTFIE